MKYLSDINITDNCWNRLGIEGGLRCIYVFSNASKNWESLNHKISHDK